VSRRRGRALLLGCALVASTATLVVAPASPTAARAATVSEASAYRGTIAGAIAELQSYWTTVFPQLYGEPYRPVPRDRIFAARPGVKLPTCAGEPTVYAHVRNMGAVYCVGRNFLAYDDVHFMPRMAQTFGAFGPVFTLAHEWGHAIQERARIVDVPGVYVELQADCFAGGFVRHVAEAGDALELEPGDLEASLGAMLAVRDAPGQSPDDPSAHGSAFDRVSAFQDGFESGPARCATYFASPPVLVELPFASREEAATGGETPPSQIVPLAANLLNDFYAQVEPAYEPLTNDDIGSFDSSKPTTIPNCGGAKLERGQVRNRVFFCIPDGYLAFDRPFLERIYDDIGDFGVASLIANPVATYVQSIQGVPGVEDNELPAVFQADCYTGGWSAALFRGVLEGGSLAPGDLDEFIEAFLVYSRERGVEGTVPITFLRVAFFRQGFLQGYQSCGYDAVAQATAGLR
jgi:predicted metalloprotease